ncbi:NAD kinase [Bifidobacterium aemilianum]|uniref:NAD kinase n=1 Tax=Bifidobacterium aemilianum TaxID=2493120 RepID=A0A366K9A7_9BIFI|nr:NAD kinase [Bifidobacterium aemilianum]RBP98274.1 NAD kinase [Bifidobacterium aemilianum]
MAARRHVVMVTHARLREGDQVVSHVVDQLRHAGFKVSIVDNIMAPSFGGDTPSVDADTEIVLVLGGDGTILRAAELVYRTDVPLLGINLGHVGFLAEFERFQMSEAIERVADRDYQIDERVLAQADLMLPGVQEPLRDWALNDITVERFDRGKMIEMGIRVDDVAMSSFSCDGLIVSTPTGSTAYGFSAGGPIIWPDVQALQLVPLAAHAVFSRPLVIGSKSSFTLDILQHSTSEGWICCDGRRQRPVPRGSRIKIRTSSKALRLAQLSEVPFTKRLVTKFNLPVVGWRERAEAEQNAYLRTQEQRVHPEESPKWSQAGRPDGPMLAGTDDQEGGDS